MRCTLNETRHRNLLKVTATNLLSDEDTFVSLMSSQDGKIGKAMVSLYTLPLKKENREMCHMLTIREIPDHATFRVKGANLAWLDKRGVSLSLAQCNLAKFDHLWFPKYSVLYTISIC